jgi:hypothetical protein
MILCDTFRKLAFDTWFKIQQSKSVLLHIGEETITDNNLLDLKIKHPKEIITRTFTKPQESKNGADWEWWLTGPSNKWFGIRIQAKIINFTNDKYEHLHYKINKTTYQSDRLIQSASENKAIPLYCLYSYWDNPTYNISWRCGSFHRVIDSFGCSLVSAYDIVKMRNKNKLNDILPYMIPWHCIICCKGYGGYDLPERALNTIRNLLNGQNLQNIELLNDPPEYVNHLLSNQLEAIKDKNIRTITIIKEENTQN